MESDELEGMSNIMNPMLDVAVDSDSLIKATQMRIWASLKEDYQYTSLPDDSDMFLRKNVFKKFDSVVLYVDLVGSTKLALELPSDKLATIMSSFAQEMANTIIAHNGLVLKFIGDAVIGYFVNAQDTPLIAERAIRCAKSMLLIIHEGINPILSQYHYPELHVRIGMDHGKNIVVRYGDDPIASHVDLMGRSMNIASKIQSAAKIDQIFIGEYLYSLLHPTTQKDFDQVMWEDMVWKYQELSTGNPYKVYSFQGQL